MNESELDKSVPDWMLPLKHEERYSDQFKKGGRTFIDIGAHVGTWTMRLAPHFERVFCFEPDMRACKALKANLDNAKIQNVEIICAAVTDHCGSVTINLYPNPSGNSLISPEQSNRKPDTDPMLRTEEVDATTLDAFVKMRGITDIDFIKVDAEGAELMIIPGAVETLKAQKPDLWVELHGLFWRRLRNVVPFMELDVIDGGRSGLNLARHRDEWPSFKAPDFRVYPAGTEPTVEQLEELRRQHGIKEWQQPRSGFLSVDGV